MAEATCRTGAESLRECAGVLRVEVAESPPHHVDLPRPGQLGGVELVHLHPTGVDGFVAIRPELGHAAVLHRLHVEGEKEHGARLRGGLAHVAPVDDAAAEPNLPPQLVNARLGTRVPDLHESRDERLLPDIWLDSTLLHEHVPHLAARIAPEHDPHRHGARGDPALPSALAALEKLAPGAAEGLALAAGGVDDARAALVDDGGRALRAEVRHEVRGNEDLLHEISGVKAGRL